MDKEEKKQWTSENYKYTGTDSEKVETQSNTGKNDSDYDGGHPADVNPKSGNQVSSKDKS